MIKKKIEDIRYARKTVRDIRAQFRKQEKNFCCYDTRKMVCCGDPCYVSPDLEPCPRYDINTRCPDKKCPMHDWNSMHYDTYIKLCDAKWELFWAYLNFFKRSK